MSSLRELDYPRDRLEIIVVDDGSDRDIDEAPVHGTDIAIRFLRQPNQGPATARNRGLREARHEYVVFLDDDCRPDADWLARLAEAAGETPDSAFGGRVFNGLTENPFAQASQLLLEYQYEYQRCHRSGPDFFTSNNLAFRAELLRGLNGFDTEFSVAGGEDRELCYRWRRMGWSLRYVPSAVVYHEHDLTAPDFWRQHFHYGMGAYQFRKIRAREQGGRLRLEPFHFYRNLLLYPWRKRQGFGAFTLMCASQLANAAGFVWRGAGGGRRRKAEEAVPVAN